MEKRKERGRLRRKKRNRNIVVIFLVSLILVYGLFEISKITTNIRLLDNRLINNESNDINENDQELYEYLEKSNEVDRCTSIDKYKVSKNNYESNREDDVWLDEDMYSDDAKAVEAMLRTANYKRNDGKKVAYLTFDDGPSEYVTKEILDILHKNNVKATFFILGKIIEKNNSLKDIVVRIKEEGHAIGNHTFTHRYDILYPDKIVNNSAFMDEIDKTEKILKNILGESFETRLIRFPGGEMSWETQNINQELSNKGYVSIDWNALNGDSDGENVSVDKLISKLKQSIENLNENKDTIVILMHDTDQKETTAQYLQLAINYLKELNYEFRTLK